MIKNIINPIKLEKVIDDFKREKNIPDSETKINYTWNKYADLNANLAFFSKDNVYIVLFQKKDVDKFKTYLNSNVKDKYQNLFIYLLDKKHFKEVLKYNR